MSVLIPHEQTPSSDYFGLAAASSSPDLKYAKAFRIIYCWSLFRRKYFMNTDLVNQMLSAQVRQMRPFLFIR